jgi:hypothetical protein
LRLDGTSRKQEKEDRIEEVFHWIFDVSMDSFAVKIGNETSPFSVKLYHDNQTYAPFPFFTHRLRASRDGETSTDVQL